MHNMSSEIDSKNKFTKPEGTSTKVFNPFIHKYVGELIAREEPGVIVGSEESFSARMYDTLFNALQGAGLRDEHRIATVAAIAQIDFSSQAQQLRRIAPGDFSAEA